MYQTITQDMHPKHHALAFAKSGFYALFDPRDGKVRYVGSSKQIELRLWQHRHNLSAKSGVAAWALEMSVSGNRIAGYLLEEMEWSGSGFPLRGQIEAKWIAHFHAIGQADLNASLTPTTPAEAGQKTRTKKTLKKIALQRGA